MTTRRDFFSLSALTAAGLTLNPNAFAQPASTISAENVKKLQPPKQPVIVTRVTGDSTIQEAWKMLASGSDTLDAAHHVCLGRENDPNDHSVGFGGLPNEEGIVELDACCMHGPSRTAGSVGGVRNIKNVCLVSRRVMQHTGHVMLAGEGAERFAVDMGFPRENMLTEDARKIWLLWKDSQKGWWGPGLASPGWKGPDGNDPIRKVALDPDASSSIHEGIVPRHPTPAWANTIRARTEHLKQMAADFGIPPERRAYAAEQILWPTTGTIHVSAVNAKGEMSGATTTSGLAWKIPGRLGDSPIIGAGCYTDQDVGSAGATGSGEENIKVVGAHTIVELMRQGLHPREAGLETLRRIVRNYNSDMEKLRYIDMEYYIVRKDGAYAGCSLWSNSSTGQPITFAVDDGTYREEVCTSLLHSTT
ncbi:MAG: N(4)-(beta-N-acetylglucosaminyl)-L-asparaginase [Acidobacteriaceae bacterium]